MRGSTSPSKNFWSTFEPLWLALRLRRGIMTGFCMIPIMQTRRLANQVYQQREKGLSAGGNKGGLRIFNHQAR